jgi:sulfide:quinone oxidoreductase
VLVDRSDTFAMGFAKLWDLAGARPLEAGTRSLHGLADRGIRFVHAEVTAFDSEARHVATTDGDVDADAVLVALGAGPSPPHRAMRPAGSPPAVKKKPPA